MRKDQLENAIIEIKNYLLELQHSICHMLEIEDGISLFMEDVWQHTAGGGGLSKIMTEGAAIEKAGVNFSHVHGDALPQAATTKRPELAQKSFQAMGVSVVVHPQNPLVPTTHMNVRFVAVEKTDGTFHWWFGGGFDLTPYYGYEEDCIHWHETAKNACDPFGKDVYSRYKKWCDDYFYLKHRNEPRGIGGIFFDDLNEWGFDTCFDFIKEIGNNFIKAYQPILSKRKNQSFNEKQKEFQIYRRGRYVEFNLLYDRGTLFGLQSNGRTESILMSLPPLVSWKYHWQPEKNSEEERLYNVFLQRKNWV